MVRRTKYVCGTTAALLAVSGCATVDPTPDYQRAAKHVAAATGQARTYQPGDDDAIADRVEELLDGGITVDEAVQVSLLNNPRLQSMFMEVGMARADVVQAGLLSNPTLGIALQFPSGGGLASLEASLAQNIAELWQLPLRKRIAERSLEQAILGLARVAADLSADTKVAYREASGGDERHRIAEENLAVAQELFDLALARMEAGAASELEVNLSRSLALDAEMDVEAARLAAADARRSLATLLGFAGDAGGLVLLDPLPDEPPPTSDPELLLGLARLSRVDLRAARELTHASRDRLREEYLRVFPNVEIGLALERGERGRSDGGRDILADTARESISNGALTAPGIEPRSARRRHTDFIIGPSLDLELPIFDQNQAQIAKAKLACAAALKTLEGLDRSIEQEVRAATDRSAAAWRLVRMYRDRALPLAQSNLDLSREAYRAGRASFLAVLEAQRFFLDARSSFASATEAAAATIPELERTIGLPYAVMMAQIVNEQDSQVTDGEEIEP